MVNTFVSVSHYEDQAIPYLSMFATKQPLVPLRQDRGKGSVLRFKAT